jgi:hypothetical protein
VPGRRPPGATRRAMATSFTSSTNAKASPNGFNQDQPTSERDESGEILGGFLAAQSNAFEPFQLSGHLLDPGASPVEPLWEKAGPVLGVGPTWDHRNDVSFAAGRTIAIGVVALVGHRRTGFDIRADVERCGQLCSIADFAPG